MSEKLTREKFDRWIQAISEAKTDIMLIGNAENLWAAIEADREAIREEVREELLKDHFKLGDMGECFTAGKWLPFKVFASLEGGYVLERKDQEIVRRPPKKRAMSNAEMAEELHKTGLGELNSQLEYLDGDTLKRLCDVLNIHTEVEE